MAIIRNLSVRLPWMTRAWDGRVGDAPLANSSCLTLKLIAEKRRDDVEDTIAGEALGH